MQLKTYQQATLDTLRRFFEAAQAHGPKAAYEAITTEPEQGRLSAVSTNGTDLRL